MQWIFWLIAIILSLGAGYLVYRADKRRAIPHPWITSLLRSLVVFFTLLLILVPTIIISKNAVEQPIVLFLQDNSYSISGALGKDSATYRKNAEGLLQRLSGKYKVVTWAFGSRVQNDSLFEYHQPATDISAVLARAQEFFGMQNLGAVILATDGRYNQGANPLYQQLSAHSALYTVALGDSAMQQDMRITRAYANKVVTVNSSFEVRADIVAERCMGYNNSVSISEGGATLSSVPMSVNSDKNDRGISFTIKATSAGLHHYIIKVPEASGEKNTVNNRKDIFVEVVDEKKNILIASGAPHPDVNAIKEALSGVESYKVTVCNTENFPASLGGYDVIILHGLPSLRADIAPRVLAAKKPVWLIVGAQPAGAQGANSLSAITHATMSPAQVHNVSAAYRSSFNAFTLPATIQSVTDKMPPLSVGVGNIQAGPGGNILFAQSTPGDAALPLWLLQQGTIPSAILFGEGLWRWRLYEFKNFNDHNVIDECIRQTVSFLAANSNEKPFSVTMPKYVWSDQEAVSMNAYLLNSNNEQVNAPDVQVTISDTTGRKQNFSFERSGSAYSLNIGVWASGTYTYAASTTYNDKHLSATGSFVVERMPLELMETGADYAMLYSLARKYNGGFVPASGIASLYDSIIRNDRVKPLIVTTTETVPLVDRKFYFFLILLIAVAEWLLRKYWLAQ